MGSADFLWKRGRGIPERQLQEEEQGNGVSLKRSWSQGKGTRTFKAEGADLQSQAHWWSRAKGGPLGSFLPVAVICDVIVAQFGA